MDDSIDQVFARLRQLFPDDVKRIDEQRVEELLRQQEYSQLPETQKLIKLCRSDIVYARMRLSSNRHLDDKARAELWSIVDARQWFLRMVSKDFQTELAQIEGELRAELER
jgi:hypothetical protein